MRKIGFKKSTVGQLVQMDECHIKSQLQPSQEILKTWRGKKTRLSNKYSWVVWTFFNHSWKYNPFQLCFFIKFKHLDVHSKGCQYLTLCFAKYFCSHKEWTFRSKCLNKPARPVGGDEVHKATRWTFSLCTNYLFVVQCCRCSTLKSSLPCSCSSI